MTNPTDNRIVKLWKAGNHSVPSIARKIGRPNDFERVMAALVRAGLTEELATIAHEEMKHEH